jgi:hypothetical protein
METCTLYCCHLHKPILKKHLSYTSPYYVISGTLARKKLLQSIYFCIPSSFYHDGNKPSRLCLSIYNRPYVLGDMVQVQNVVAKKYWPQISRFRSVCKTGQGWGTEGDWLAGARRRREHRRSCTAAAKAAMSFFNSFSFAVKHR